MIDRMPSVLFVCTANICRSPMAMAIFRFKLGTLAEDWRVESAGTWTRDGEPAASKVVALLAERGLDLRQHRSRGVTEELINSFDLILTMERGHKEALQIEFPQQAGRIFLFTEVVGQVYDIPDPIGGSLDDFRETLEEIDLILTNGYDRICELTQGCDRRENR